MPVLEGLVLVMAVRLWGANCGRLHAPGEITDNLGSTFVLAKLRSANRSLIKIAAELALDMAERLYKSMKTTHIRA